MRGEDTPFAIEQGPGLELFVHLWCDEGPQQGEALAGNLGHSHDLTQRRVFAQSFSRLMDLSVHSTGLRRQWSKAQLSIGFEHFFAR